MAEVLAAFLLGASFSRGGADEADKRFGLVAVEPIWPDPKVEAPYPSASIIERGPTAYEQHSLTPTCLDDTFNVFCSGSVLWKTAEAVATFQVDYWCCDDPTREGIAARLPALFSPGEGRAGVVLAGDPRYFRRPVRATLESNQRIDTANAVFDRERRLSTVVRCDIDVVHLRQAVELQPRMVLRDGDPEDC